MITGVKHYFQGVPGIGNGNVAVARHAQAKCIEQRIPEEVFEDVLRNGHHAPDGPNCMWREKDGVRLVIVPVPEPFNGTALVVTAFRVSRQARVR